jgi:ferritin-like metal-binding protein YciE
LAQLAFFFLHRNFDKEGVSMQTAHELFVHELTDMLDAEQKLVEALGNQAEESSRPDLQKAFQSHQQQTQKQVERLQQCFELLDEEAEETECRGIAGIIAEHDTFKEEEDPSEDLMDIFNVGAASKVESYEIAAYESLINLAQQLEQTKVERLLNQNLKEEQQTLKKMQAFTKKLKPQQLEMEEGEEEDSEVYGESGEDEYASASDEESSSNSSRSRGGKKSSSSVSKQRRGKVA